MDDGLGASAKRGALSRKVLKVMSVFTGVESLNIICSIVKTKLAAMWLDAFGIGLFNIFQTTVDTTTALTGLGLRQSAVRDVAMAQRQGEEGLLRTVRRVRAWSLLSGLLGAVVLVSFSVPLSLFAFGNDSMWWCFVLLGATLLLNALYAGEGAVFQGTEQFKRMARTSVELSVTGLLVSIPMFRYLGENSVVLSILAYAAAGVFFAYLNSEKRFKITNPTKEDYTGDNKFVKFGAYLAISAFFASLCQTIFSYWLNRVESTAMVGLYGAGVTLVIRYTGMIFSAVSLEYYPRVAAVSANAKRVAVFMNHEIMLLMLLFTPFLFIFLIFRHIIVLVLYTPQFMAIIPYITWASLTMLLRAASNTMAYTIIAKGDGKVYMITEIVDAVLGLGLMIWGYEAGGLIGIGMAMVTEQFLYLVACYEICRRRYGLLLKPEVRRLLAVSLLAGGLAVGAVFILPEWLSVMLLSAGTIVYGAGLLRMLGQRKKRRA